MVSRVLKEETVLYEAVAIASDELIDDLIMTVENEPDPVFSKRYKKRKKEIIRYAEKQLREKDNVKYSENREKVVELQQITHRTFSKTLKYALVAALLLALCTVSAIAYVSHDNSWDFIFNTAGDMTDVVFNDDTSTKGFLYGEYTYVPEDYNLVSNNMDKVSQNIVYENANGEMIMCTSSQNEGAVGGWDTENVVVEEVKIAQTIKGAYIKDDLTATSMLSWVTGKYHHEIVADNLSKEELIKMAGTRVESN